MAKPKSPLLSLGARGTIGDALTYQKRGQGTIVREKPIPRDPYSLAQAYQRWDYKDYAHLWTLLTNSEKQIYRTKASRYHITGFSQWMRERLKELTYLEGRWHLDYVSAGVTPDSSKNAYHGVVTGASIADGIIDHALNFDGLNDVVRTPVMWFPVREDLTFEFIFVPTLPSDNATRYVWLSWGAWSPAIYIEHYSANWTLLGTDGGTYINVYLPFAAGEKHHIALTFDSSDNKFHCYYDGVFMKSSVVVNPAFWPTVPEPIIIGAFNGGTRSAYGLIDEVSVYKYLMPTELIKRHSERRYPV